MNRFMRLVPHFVLGLLLASVATAVSAQTAAQERYPVTVANSTDCPIQIVERRARVSNTLVRHPWTALSGKDPRKDQLRDYGSGEIQLVYDIAFKNTDSRPAAGIAFLWEAMDKDGNLLFKRLDTWNAEPVAPGRYELLHEIDTSPAGDIAGYRLSVLKVHLTDGSVWNPGVAMSE